MKHALLILLALCIGATACGEQKEQPLNAKARKIISQSYADTVRTITPLVDSLCKTNRSALIDQLTDSLYAVRIADLDRQRKRFKQ